MIGQQRCLCPAGGPRAKENTPRGTPSVCSSARCGCRGTALGDLLDRFGPADHPLFLQVGFHLHQAGCVGLANRARSCGMPSSSRLTAAKSLLVDQFPVGFLRLPRRHSAGPQVFPFSFSSCRPLVAEHAAFCRILGCFGRRLSFFRLFRTFDFFLRLSLRSGGRTIDLRRYSGAGFRR